jgi:hypothetical protein
MEDLVNKFTTGTTYQKRQPKSTVNARRKSKSRSGGSIERRMNSKEKKKTDIDKISEEVERQLKAQRK